jgi:molybdopterin converting factor small subunit
VTVCVVAFARIREILGAGEHKLALRDGATIADAWDALVERAPALESLRTSTRIARDGRMASESDVLRNGDEIALLPPSGGG